MKRFVKQFLCMLLALCLLSPLLPAPVEAAGAVVYDAANISRFQRTPENVTLRWYNALQTGPSYNDGIRETWFVRPSSTVYPYDQGELTQDTVDHMAAIVNYVRWLSGSEPLTIAPKKRDDMQRCALIRNFDFSHTVRDSYKPADMPQALWDSGKVTNHSLSLNQTPAKAIIGWVNEGYILSTNQWGTVGHRFNILEQALGSIDFGYSGEVCAATINKYGNSTSAPFSAYPAPGPMPTQLVYAAKSAWSLQLNESVFQVPNSGANLKVTVTNAATGESYSCTKDNGKLRYATWMIEDINFVQPPCGDSNYAPGSVYNVVVTGLKEKSSGKDAEIRYQVNFFDLEQYKPYDPFVDVTESDWFYTSVLWAYHNDPQITAGIDEVHFSPHLTVTRAEAMVFFWAANNRPDPEATKARFKDVRKSHWAFKAVMWAVKNGITGGTDPEGKYFSPARTCTRSEIIQFLYAAMGKPEYHIANPYSDVKNKHWYKDGAIWAYEMGIERGENGKFNATTPCTRAYVVTYLYRYLTGDSLDE